MIRKRLGLWAPILVLAAALVMFAVSGAEVDAAPKAGKGGGKPGGSTPTLTVSPSRVPLGATSIVISGSGFGARQPLSINTWYIPSPSVTTDDSGAFSFTYFHTFTMPKDGTVQAWSTSRHPALLATGYYTVCATDPCP